MTHTNFQIFLEISLAVMVEIVDFSLKAVIGFLEIYTIKSLIKNSFIWGSTTKTKKILLLLLKETLVLGHVNHVFDRICSFKHKPLFNIFTFAIIFFVLDDVIDLEIRRWRIEAPSLYL